MLWPITSMADGSQSLQGVCVCSVMSLFRSPWTVADQASLTMEFSRQGYWSELFFPSPRDLLDPGIRLMSLASPALAGGFFTTVPPGKPSRAMVWLSKFPEFRQLNAVSSWAEVFLAAYLQQPLPFLVDRKKKKKTTLLCWSLCK